MWCCDGRKILTTTFCKYYNNPDNRIFERASRHDKVLEGVFWANAQNKKKKKEDILQVQKNEKNSATTVKAEIEEHLFNCSNLREEC